MLTIGERIKYCRQRRGLTQAQLAEFSGIHPVSIRKYETNKMQPQPAQIEKIARVLCVNLTAISAPHTQTIQLKTIGDLMGLLITCHKSGILSIQGERGERDILLMDSVRFVPNPLFQKYFSLVNQDEKEETTQLGSLTFDIPYHIPTKPFSNLLLWEKAYNEYQSLSIEFANTENKHIKAVLDELKGNLELMEMELQIAPEFL